MAKNKNLKHQLREQQLADSRRTRTASVDDDFGADDGDDTEDIEAEGFDEGNLSGEDAEDDLDLSASDDDDIIEDDEDLDGNEFSDDEDDITASDDDGDEDDFSGEDDCDIDEEDVTADDDDAGDLYALGDDAEDMDEEDSDTADWIDQNVTAGLVEVANRNVDVKSKTKLVAGLRQCRYRKGAKLIASLTSPQFQRFAKIASVFTRNAKSAIAAVRKRTKVHTAQVARLRNAGDRRGAELREAAFRKALQSDLATQDTSLVTPNWFARKAKAFIRANEDGIDDPMLDDDSMMEDEDLMAGDTDLPVDLVDEESDLETTAQILHHLVGKGKIRKAVACIKELRADAAGSDEEELEEDCDEETEEEIAKSAKIVARLVGARKVRKAVSLLRRLRADAEDLGEDGGELLDLGDGDITADDVMDDGDTTEVNLDDDADTIAARVVASLSRGKRTRTAVRLLAGPVRASAQKDLPASVRIIASLVRKGKTKLAAKMVKEIRASFVNPNMKATEMDPTRPITGPSRGVGGTPDAGTSYGMSEDDARKCAEALDCSPDALGWVKAAPFGDDGELDPEGSWACYSSTPGDDEDEEQILDMASCKAYLQSKVATAHAIFLSEIKAGTKVPAERIAMTLHDAGSDNPYYNVIVAGVPFGTIQLQHQKNPEAIRSAFVGTAWADGVRSAAATFGVNEALDQLAVQRWSLAFNASDVVVRERERVAKTADSVIEEQVQRRLQDRLDLMLLAHEESNRNLSKTPSALKFGLYEVINEAGVRNAAALADQAAAYEIQDGDGQYVSTVTAYLNMLMARAVEFEDMHPQALKQITEHITGSPVQLRQASKVTGHSDTLRERLANSNIPFTNVPGAADPTEPRTASTRDIRARIGLGGAHRRDR